MVKSLDILKDLAIHFSNNNFKIFLSYESELLDVNAMATVNINQQIINLSFEVMGSTTIAAMITKVCYDYFVQFPDFRIQITDPYHLIFDKDGKYINSLFGNEALEFAEVIKNDDNSKEIEIIKKSAKKEDQQKKIDRLLDQINISGVNSLTKGERYFLSKLK